MTTQNSHLDKQEKLIRYTTLLDKSLHHSQFASRTSLVNYMFTDVDHMKETSGSATSKRTIKYNFSATEFDQDIWKIESTKDKYGQKNMDGVSLYEKIP